MFLQKKPSKMISKFLMKLPEMCPSPFLSNRENASWYSEIKRNTNTITKGLYQFTVSQYRFSHKQEQSSVLPILVLEFGEFG